MNLAQSPNVNYLWAQLIIEELIRNDVTYFCIASGSRSAPLTVSAAQNSKATTFLHFDERGAAFHALGYVSATKRPCALICTSGTAVANFLPAIIEAAKKKLPLIVLTADRPPELRLTGADQTIDQVGIFGSYVRWQVDLPCPTKDINPEFVLTTVDQAIFRAKGELKGPVHINCMFREPLAPIKTQGNFTNYIKSISYWQEGTEPFTKYVACEQALEGAKRDTMASAIAAIKKGVIVVGKLGSEKEKKSVLNLAAKLNWPISPDITSGLRLGNSHKNIIHHFDQLLLSEEFKKQFRPDGILHLGGRITSKRWYQWIEEIDPMHYIMVNNHPLRNDPLHNVTLRFQGSVAEFCDSIFPKIKFSSNENYLEKWQIASEKVENLISEFIQNGELNEPSAAYTISKLIPRHHALFVASSMPIRDLDMYATAHANDVIVGANRGASGIDGTIATAAGFSVGLNRSVTLMIGDLAFLHDINSLHMLKDAVYPLIIVVFNNNGGGIFSFLPIANSSENFEKYFGTPHNLNFEPAAKLFNLNYVQPKSLADFNTEYEKALKVNRSTIIEINTDRTMNHRLHQEWQRDIRNSINKFLESKARKGQVVTA